MKDTCSPPSLASFESLLEFHHTCEEAFRNNQLFRLMQKSLIGGQKHRDIFFEYLQIWSDQFQNMIFFRSSFCQDPDFQEVFSHHFDEEYGHNKILSKERTPLFLKKDPIIEALASWFPYQMLSTTPAQKLVISILCLESASDIFHEEFMPFFDPQSSSHYSQVHSMHDHNHKELGRHLLQGLASREYEQLTRTLDQAWKVFNALFDRMSHLILEAEPL